jgi:hypothetical protein
MNLKEECNSNCSLSDQFRSDGYTVLPNFYSLEEVECIKHVLRTEIDTSRDQSQSTFFDLTGRDPLFAALVRNARLTSVLSKLIGANLSFHHSKLHCGGRIGVWHRDICSYPHTNAEVLMVSIYLDNVDAKHGALQVIQGSHKPTSWDMPLTLGSDFESAESMGNVISLEVAAGGICIHHSCLLHRPTPCIPGRPRNVVLCSFRSADSEMLVPNTFAEAMGGTIVAGVAPTTWRVEEISTVFAEECLTISGELLPRRREDGLRIRSTKCSMM